MQPGILLKARLSGHLETTGRTSQWGFSGDSVFPSGVSLYCIRAGHTVDAIYLWIHRAVPEGVNYSEYVHQGVHSLTFAVLLSALVLAMVYQQASQVIESRIVHILALRWIAQNVVLLAGVLMRLQLYVRAYQLTELRVYMAAFLCLVATGFALLAWRIVNERSLHWLVLANGVAAFVLFFLIQFADVAKWVADRNVARWQEDSARSLDIAYLTELGPSANPALIIAAETPGPSEAHDAFMYLDRQRPLERWRMRTGAPCSGGRIAMPGACCASTAHPQVANSLRASRVSGHKESGPLNGTILKMVMRRSPRSSLGASSH